MAIAARALNADRISHTFARQVGAAASPGPADLLGLEHEYSLILDGRQVDFQDLIHRIAVPGRRLDPADPNAYRCRWGGVITCDGREAEIVSPPVRTRPGFAAELDRGARLGLGTLAPLLPRRTELRGYSTHLSASVPDDLVDATAVLYLERFAVPLMMLLDDRGSPGLLVRPRPGRLELGGEYAEGETLCAAATFVAGSVLAAAEAARDRRLAALPPALAFPILPSVERFGWYVDRNAFGADLYAKGRATPLQLALGGWTSAQDQLDAAWRIARERLVGRATSAELRLVDELVAGVRLLRLERERPAETVNLTGTLDRLDAAGDPHGAVVDDIVRPAFKARARLATWSCTVFEVMGAARTIFICVPRASLASFLRLVRDGDLDRTIVAYADAASTQRRLDSVAATGRPGLHDSMASSTALIPSERAPSIGGTEVRPGKRRVDHKTDGSPVRRWRQRLFRAAALGVAAVLIAFVIAEALPDPPRRPSISAVDEVDFGTVAVTDGGGGTRTRTIEVTNGGAAPLTVRGAPIDYEARSDYEVTRNPCKPGPVQPGGSCTLTVIFHPSRPGSRSGLLTIVADDVERYPIRLTGSGRAPTPPPTAPPTPAPLRLTYDRTIDFGEMPITEESRDIVVRSSGGADRSSVRILRSGLSGSGDTDVLHLDLAGCAGYRFTARAQTCRMVARFTWPRGKAEGPYSATYTFRTTAGPRKVTLRGTLEAIVIEVTPEPTAPPTAPPTPSPSPYVVE